MWRSKITEDTITWRTDNCESCHQMGIEASRDENKDKDHQWLCVGEIIKPENPKDLHEKYNSIRLCIINSFEDERIILQDGSKLTIQEIHKDFELFVGRKIKPQKMGYILRKHGFKSKSSNGVTYYKNYAFNTDQDQTRLTV